MEFDGKVAVVTGAAAGIGRACAEGLARAGARVVLGDIDAEQGAAVASGIGATARFVAADMRQMADARTLAAVATEAFGGVDILVNNAAVGIRGIVDEMDEDGWDQVIDLNLTGYWRGMKACVPLMRARGGGAVVNMSSVQGMRGFKGWAAYAAAKGGVSALTVQSAIDLAPAGIRVNAVAPGTIMTPLNEKVFAAQPDGGAALRDEWNRAHPIGRFGQPQEVAEAVLYLASDRASFVTGEILRVDGGLAMKGE